MSTKDKVEKILNSLENKYAKNIREILFKGKSMYGNILVARTNRNPRRKKCLICGAYIKQYGKSRSELGQTYKEDVIPISINRSNEKIIEGWVHTKRYNGEPSCLEKVIGSYERLNKKYEETQQKKLEQARELTEALKKLDNIFN